MTTQPRREIKRRAEPIDERGDLKEAVLVPENSPRQRPPPPRLDSLTFPTDRLPRLEVAIVKRLPGVGNTSGAEEPDPEVNQNIDPSVPGVVRVDKSMYNLWEQTRTQTEVTWSKPDNAGQFNSIIYEIQIMFGEEGWQDLTESRQALYRVYFVEGKAMFGRHHVTRGSSTKVVRLRVRPVGVVSQQGQDFRKPGLWSEDILFSLEGHA